LADTARPISPEADGEDVDAAAEVANEVDFDDGISAISSHTLEEMERRRQARERRNVLRIHPLDFSQIIDENIELEPLAEFGNEEEGGQEGENEGPAAVSSGKEGNLIDKANAEVVFGQPFYEETGLFQNVRTVVDESTMMNNTRGGVPVTAALPPPSSPSALARVTSTKTHNTTMTEDSHEFEEMYHQHEALYWIDQDRVANVERNARQQQQSNTNVGSGGSGGRCRQSQRMSIEERAARLRELSRSRSRSDGTGSVSIYFCLYSLIAYLNEPYAKLYISRLLSFSLSCTPQSNKSATSSLVSGQHPHDTVPVFPSDLFSTRRKKSTTSNGAGSGRSRRYQNNNAAAAGAFVPGSTPLPGVSAEGDSDPFAMDFGEI
jgi:hypothetical protein